MTRENNLQFGRSKGRHTLYVGQRVIYRTLPRHVVEKV